MRLESIFRDQPGSDAKHIFQETYWIKHPKISSNLISGCLTIRAFMRLSLDCFYGRFHSIRFSFRIDEAQAQSDEDYSNRDIEGFREIAIVCGSQ